MTFRARLIFTAMITLAVGLGALLVAGNVLLDRRVGVEASNVLHGRAEAEVAALTIRDGRVIVRETPNDVELDRSSWVLEGRRVVERPPAVSAGLDRRAVALGRTGRAAEVEGPNDTRLLVRPLVERDGSTVGAVVVAASTTSLERLQQEVFVGSFVLAALTLLAGWFAIRSAVDGALRPVAQMTSAAEEWGAHDLDRRFDLGPARDELTGLAATLDHLLARIAASRRHEQRFAEDAAHELRTPVTRLRGEAELALGATGPDADARRVAALRTVVAETEELERAVHVLMDVARRSASGGEQGVDLGALAASFAGVTVVAPPDLPRAEGDPEIVRRALAPLVENAQRHRATMVSIELAAGHGRVHATVRDDGPGLDRALGERVFEPGVQGPDEAGGAGLGLPLARRLARACGGDVTLGEGPGGCVVLELPEAAR